MPNPPRSEVPRSIICRVEYAEGKQNEGPENDVDLAGRDFTVTAAECVKGRKRPRDACQTKTLRKKARRDRPHSRTQSSGYNRVEKPSSTANIASFPPSAFSSEVGDCIVVGKGEISFMEMRNYINTQSKSSLTDPLSIQSPTTIQNPIRHPTPPYTETSVGSPQIDHPPPTPSRGVVFKAHEALSILETMGEEQRESQGGQTRTEKVFTNTIEPLSPQSTIVTGVPISTCLLWDQLQSDNTSGALPAVRQLSIADLLNPSTTEYKYPLHSIMPKTVSTAPPSTDIALSHLQDSTYKNSIRGHNLNKPSLPPRAPDPHLRTGGIAYPAYNSKRHHLPARPLGPSSVAQIVVRIQENEHGTYSRRYNETVLYPKTNEEFFDWFVFRTSYACSSGPAELKFTFKDALPEAKSNMITRGNEEHFEYMKRDINQQCNQATGLMPEMIEFVILVSVPG